MNLGGMRTELRPKAKSKAFNLWLNHFAGSESAIGGRPNHIEVVTNLEVSAAKRKPKV